MIAKSSEKLWFVGGEDLHLRIPLLLQLRAMGYKVGAAGTTQQETFRKYCIPYAQYSLSRRFDPLRDLRSYRELIAVFERHRPNIVHAFDTKPGILAPLAAQHLGIDVRVRTITGMGYVFSSNSPLALCLRPVYRAWQRKASKAAAFTVFQNQDDREYFCRHGLVHPAQAKVVYSSGIDVDAWTAAGTQHQDQLTTLRTELNVNRRPVVTMVSRINRHKGVVDFLRAAREVRSCGHNALFLLVGPLESQPHLAVPRQVIDAYQDDVVYLGPRPDVARLLSLSDVFVLPSCLREGTPRVLLEAGAMGLPLVATNMPGCRDVVRHGINGALVPCRDYKAIAGELVRMLGSKPLRRAMGSSARSHVREHFSLDKVAAAYTEIYRPRETVDNS